MFSRVSFLLAVGGFSTLAFANAHWITPDFFIDDTAGSYLSWERRPSPNETCREHISKVMCLVDPVAQEDIGKERPLSTTAFMRQIS